MASAMIVMIAIGGLFYGGATIMENHSDPPAAQYETGAEDATAEGRERGAQPAGKEDEMNLEDKIERRARESLLDGNPLGKAIATGIGVKLVAVVVPLVAIAEWIRVDGTLYEVVFGVPKERQDEHRAERNRQFWEDNWAEHQRREAQLARMRREGVPIPWIDYHPNNPPLRDADGTYSWPGRGKGVLLEQWMEERGYEEVPRSFIYPTTHSIEEELRRRGYEDIME